jgi:hypothetical protein
MVMTIKQKQRTLPTPPLFPPPPRKAERREQKKIVLSEMEMRGKAKRILPIPPLFAPSQGRCPQENHEEEISRFPFSSAKKQIRLVW